LHQISRGDMPGSSFGTARRSKRRREPPPCTSSGSALDSPPAPTSWIDRIGLRRPAPAAVDDLLRAALHLRVAALHRSEVEVGGVGAGRHARGRAAAQPDQHAGPPSWISSVPGANFDLQRRAGADVAEPPAIMIGL
jgi:hypothetical protein